MSPSLSLPQNKQKQVQHLNNEGALHVMRSFMQIPQVGADSTNHLLFASATTFGENFHRVLRARVPSPRAQFAACPVH